MDRTEKDVFRLEKLGPLHLGNFTIFQICDIQTADGSICLPHIQQCDEISYITSGCCKHVINNREWELGPGDMMFLRKGDVHSYTTDSEKPARIFNLGICMKQEGNSALAEMWNELNGYSTPLLLCNMTQVQKLFVGIFEEMVGKKYGWEYAVQLYIEQIFLAFCRGLRKIHVSPYTPQNSEESQKRLLYSMINYLDTHVEEMNALKDMCNVFHYTYAHISHFFKKMMGISISDYYKQKRFGYAAELLLEEKYSITEISSRMGYQTVHAFSKAFSNFYGMCPTQYLQTKRENGDEYII